MDIISSLGEHRKHAQDCVFGVVAAADRIVIPWRKLPKEVERQVGRSIRVHKTHYGCETEFISNPPTREQINWLETVCNKYSRTASYAEIGYELWTYTKPDSRLVQRELVPQFLLNGVSRDELYHHTVEDGADTWYWRKARDAKGQIQPINMAAYYTRGSKVDVVQEAARFELRFNTTNRRYKFLAEIDEIINCRPDILFTRNVQGIPPWLLPMLPKRLTWASLY